MKIMEILLTLIIFSVALIIYYSMFGSVVTAITGAAANWSCVGASANATTCLATDGTDLSWLPGILIILAAILPLIAVVLVVYAEFNVS